MTLVLVGRIDQEEKGEGNSQPEDSYDAHVMVWVGVGINKGGDPEDEEERIKINYL